MKKKYVVILAIFVIISTAVIFAIGMFRSAGANLEQLITMVITDRDLSCIDDGVYAGSYEVFPVAVEVKVAVEDHMITDVELVKHQNGQGADAEILTEQIVEKQSLQLDAISGATYSSKVILKAVENALDSASN